MALATILSRAQNGMEAPLVSVEVDIASGLPALTLVGLPETVVKESKDRVRAAIANCNFELPAGRITVNLAPADLPKEGGRFDLPIAIGILVASGQLPPASCTGCEFFGELSLSGELRAVSGALPATLAAGQAGHFVVLPTGNGAEASLVSNCSVATANHLLEVCAHLSGGPRLVFACAELSQPLRTSNPDLGDVRGQAQAKRALEIAAAGEHSLLLIGPPGTGKSMLAQRLPGLLPPMTDAEALEAAAIRSITGRGLKLEEWRVRPFRSPHHTASGVALVGGGSHPRPGEISLAHNGVLFLDEFAVRRSVNCRYTKTRARCSKSDLLISTKLEKADSRRHLRDHLRLIAPGILNPNPALTQTTFDFLSVICYRLASYGDHNDRIRRMALA
jgi:magnesium chelatase family protein